MSHDQELLDYLIKINTILVECQYFDLQTDSCQAWGSPQCNKCQNFVKGE
ncbi:MAG: hypothetical protein ACFFG0_18360 [Candidatus Thorarchaeota archaeon]